MSDLAPLQSEPLILDIVAPDKARRQARLDADLESLRSADAPMRLKATQDLQYIADDSTIPPLVTCLEDTDSGVVHEAEFALLALPDSNVVRQRILSVLQDDKHMLAPAASEGFTRVLWTIDLRGKSPKEPGFSEFSKHSWQQWRETVAAKLGRQVDRIPPDQAGDYVLAGLSSGWLDRAHVLYWQTLFKALPRMPELEQDGVADMVERFCGDPELTPDLSNLAVNEALIPQVRVAAMVQLSHRGSDTYRDMLVDDITKLDSKLATPPSYSNFVPPAWLIGDYRQREIAEKLLAMVHQVVEQPTGIKDNILQSIPRRLRDYGAGATAEEIRDAFTVFRQRFPYEGQRYFLEALAGKAPELAVPFIRDIVNDPRWRGNQLLQDAVTLLVRIDTPPARALIEETLRGSDEVYARYMLGLLTQSVDGREGAQYDPPLPLPPARAFARSFFPEALAVYKASTNADTKRVAADLLMHIGGSSLARPSQLDQAAETEWLARCGAWWEKNRVNFGR